MQYFEWVPLSNIWHPKSLTSLKLCRSCTNCWPLLLSTGARRHLCFSTQFIHGNVVWQYNTLGNVCHYDAQVGCVHFFCSFVEVCTSHLQALRAFSNHIALIMRGVSSMVTWVLSFVTGWILATGMHWGMLPWHNIEIICFAQHMICSTTYVLSIWLHHGLLLAPHHVDWTARAGGLPVNQRDKDFLYEIRYPFQTLTPKFV